MGLPKNNRRIAPRQAVSSIHISYLTSLDDFAKIARNCEVVEASTSGLLLLIRREDLIPSALRVFFDPPEKSLSEKRFAAILARKGIRLDARSQLLFAGNRFFMNGESVAVARREQATFRRLADERSLPGSSPGTAGLATLYDWYCCGFAHLS